MVTCSSTGGAFIGIHLLFQRWQQRCPIGVQVQDPVPSVSHTGKIIIFRDESCRQLDYRLLLCPPPGDGASDGWVCTSFIIRFKVEVPSVLLLTQPVCMVPNENTRNLYFQADDKRFKWSSLLSSSLNQMERPSLHRSWFLCFMDLDTMRCVSMELNHGTDLTVVKVIYKWSSVTSINFWRVSLELLQCLWKGHASRLNWIRDPATPATKVNCMKPGTLTHIGEGERISVMLDGEVKVLKIWEGDGALNLCWTDDSQLPERGPNLGGPSHHVQVVQGQLL